MGVMIDHLKREVHPRVAQAIALFPLCVSAAICYTSKFALWDISARVCPPATDW